MTKPLSDERLAEIRARVEAATEGPWKVWVRVVLADAWTPSGQRGFMAHAHQDVADLLAEVDRLRALTGIEVDPDYPDSPGGYCRNCSQWVPDRDFLIHDDEEEEEEEESR